MKKIFKKTITKVIIVVFAVLVSVAVVFFMSNRETEEVSAWWNDGWSYRKALVINHGYVTEDLTNFPVLVSLTDSNLSSHAQEDGDDFVFTLGSTGEVLKHEIEKYASSTGELVAWVKIPSLSSTEDTTIYICITATRV